VPAFLAESDHNQRLIPKTEENFQKSALQKYFSGPKIQEKTVREKFGCVLFKIALIKEKKCSLITKLL